MDSLILVGTDMHLSGRRGSLYAFDRKSGERAWRTPADPGLPCDLCKGGESVFALSLDDELTAFDVRTGTRRWTFTGRRDSVASGGNDSRRQTDRLTSSPLCIGDLVLCAGRDSVLRAVSASSGEQIWSRAFARVLTTPPCRVDDRVAVGTGGRTIALCDPARGTLILEHKLEWTPRETMLSHGGTLFLLGGDESERPSVLAALDPFSGELLWQRRAPGADGGAFWSVPRLLLWQGGVIAATNEGRIVACDPETGRIDWEHKVEGSARGIGSSAQMLFVGTLDGMLYALGCRVEEP